MSDETLNTRTTPLEGIERKDANTVMTAVNTAATVVNAGVALWNAKQGGTEKPPPKQDKDK
jgi:hypothetical protein